jgi:positive regulator of sigma E activity
MNEADEVTEDLAIVREVTGKQVVVEMQRNPGCSSCRAHSLCMGNDRPPTHIIETDIPLAVGDQVRIGISPGVKMLSSVMLFIFPLGMLFLFYAIARLALSFGENGSIGVSMIGLLLSGIIIKVFDRRFAGKVHFEILERMGETNDHPHQ